MSAIVHSFALLFFVIEMKTDLFQSCDYRWVFQIAGIFSQKCLQNLFLIFKYEKTLNILTDSKLSFTDVMQLHFKCCEEAET